MPSAAGSRSRTPRPMLPPTCTGRPASFEDVGGEGGGRRLAVRAGDGDDLRRAVEPLPLRRRERAEEEADVVVDGDARVPGRRDRRMRRRVEMRDAGRDDDGLHALVALGPRQVGERDPLGLRLVARGGTVVPGDDLGAAGHERGDRRAPGAAEAEDGDLVAGVAANRDHARAPPRPCRRAGVAEPGWRRKSAARGRGAGREEARVLSLSASRGRARLRESPRGPRSGRAARRPPRSPWRRSSPSSASYSATASVKPWRRSPSPAKSASHGGTMKTRRP